MLKSLLSEVTSTPTRPVDNVVIATKGLQDRNTNIIAGTTVENKGKLILTDWNVFYTIRSQEKNLNQNRAEPRTSGFLVCFQLII